MLLNSLYTITSLVQSDGSIEAHIELNAAHHIFKGHFPGQPVLPGACQLDMIKELLEQALGKKLILRSASSLKFISMINPDMSPALAVKIDYTYGDGYKITAAISNNLGTCAKLQAQYSIKD